MLRYQAEPIHTSLLAITAKPLRRTAVKTFRQVQAFMGDRPVAKPSALAQDIMQEAIANPELRDEVLLQVMKQLRDNPSSASIERGWVLLQLLLRTFSPSEEAENFVEHFLRTRGAVDCIRAMHRTLFRGTAAAPLDASTIDAALGPLLAAAASPSLVAAASVPLSATVSSPSALPLSPAQRMTLSPMGPTASSGADSPPARAARSDLRASIMPALLASTPPSSDALSEELKLSAPLSSGSVQPVSASTTRLRLARPPGPPPPDAKRPIGPS